MRPGKRRGSPVHLTRQPDLQTDRPITNIDQILLSFGLSMTIDVLLGFGLNFLPIGFGSLFHGYSRSGLITMIFVMLAIFLRQRDAPAPSASLAPSRIRITAQGLHPLRAWQPSLLPPQSGSLCSDPCNHNPDSYSVLDASGQSDEQRTAWSLLELKALKPLSRPIMWL